MKAMSMTFSQALRTVLLLAPLTVAAQPLPPGAGMDGAQTAPWTRPSAARELTLTQVHERLGLNPAQQELWRWFENRVEAYVSTYYRQKSVLPSPDDPATHQVGRMVDNLQNRLAALEQVESATRNLYASLTSEQQKTANQLLIQTIPNFGAAPGNGAAEARRREGKDGKSESGRRFHRPGSSGFGASPPPN